MGIYWPAEKEQQLLYEKRPHKNICQNYGEMNHVIGKFSVNVLILPIY